MSGAEPRSLIKTVIVDDSAFVRKAVQEMLALSPHIEVVGTARNGADGLRVVAETEPDVVTCDLLMPELDGVAFVREQMARNPLPILILSASPQDAERVLAALEAGAVDFVQKPTALANHDLLSMRADLVQKIKVAAGAPVRPRPAQPIVQRPTLRPNRLARQVQIVVLGVSTGGPQALRYLVPQLPVDFPVPLVMVLHIPVGYTAPFAERLSEISTLPVREAVEGCVVQPREALLAPAGRHLRLQRAPDGQVRVRLSVQPLDKPHRPSVDVLFESAAQAYESRVLGVVMTGMGDDGKQGAACIKQAGGMILTEAEESCIVYGMPRSVVEAGLSDAAVPLTSMAEAICRHL